MTLSETRKYRKFTARQKLELVLASLRREKTIAELCREHAISETLLRRWRDQVLEAGVERLAGAQDGCTYIGATGTEILTSYFESMYEQMAQDNVYDQIPFYELGHSFWFWSPQLQFQAPDQDPVVTGSAVSMRPVPACAAFGSMNSHACSSISHSTSSPARKSGGRPKNRVYQSVLTARSETGTPE